MANLKYTLLGLLLAGAFMAPMRSDAYDGGKPGKSMIQPASAKFVDYQQVKRYGQRNHGTRHYGHRYSARRHYYGGHRYHHGRRYHHHRRHYHHYHRPYWYGGYYPYGFYFGLPGFSFYYGY